MQRDTFSTTKNIVTEAPRLTEGAVVGRYLQYPDTTGGRRYEGGLRLRGNFKQNQNAIPLVTIVTVVYNNADTIEQCMRSVLNQDYDNIEYVVVDGGSTDGTLAAIQKYADGIDYFVSEPDEGLYHAMNKGLSLACGDYVAFLNADDYYLSHAVSASIEHILGNNLDLSYAGFLYADGQGHAVVADEGRAWDDSMLIQGIPGGHETIFAHKRCYSSVGGYDLSFKLAADYHWVMRAYKAGFAAQPMPRTILVMALGGTSFDESIELEENRRLLRENFGDLDESTLTRLYQLKFYKNWHGCSIPDADMLELLSEANQISKEYHRALFLTIECRKRAPRGVILPAAEKAPEKLKIAVALTFLTGVSGGAERIAIEMANELARRGHAVTVVSCHGLAGEPYYTLDESVPYIDIAIDPYKLHYENLGKGLDLNFEDFAGRQFDQLAYVPSEEDFAEWCESGHLWRTRMYHGFFKEHDFDLVISHMPSTFPYVLLAREQNDTAIHVAALHNAPSFKFYSELYPAESTMVRYMRLLSLEMADRVSILFEAFREQMPEPYREKCFTLPNFTSINQTELRQSDKSSKTILSVGRLAPQKEHATLLRSYAKIKERHPDWALRIYGEGPLQGELSELCRELELDFEDIFRGVRQDIEAVYQEAAIFAFPSLFEGFGLTLVEAMAFGVPAIGFADCEGVKYLIDHETNGLLVSRTQEDDDLAEALNRLIESPELRRSLGEEGMKTAARHTVAESVDALERAIGSDVTHRLRDSEESVGESSGMNVAVVATYLEGGAGIAAVRLQQGLVQQGVNCKTLSLSPVHDEYNYQARLVPPMQALFSSLDPFLADDNRAPGGTVVSPCYPSLTTDQLSLLDYFDVINIHWVQRILSNEAIASLANLGKPLVWTMHDMNPLTGGCHYSDGCERYQTDCHDCPQLNDSFDDYPAKVLAAKKHHWPENIVLVSPSRWLAECARNSAVFKDHRIEVIPNSLDTDTFRPYSKQEARRKLNLPQYARILLFTSYSHNERRKGFDELLKTAELLRSRGQHFHITTFGKGSPDIADSGLPYTALGYVTDDETLSLGYSAADVTVLPTLEDNLPNIILESVACGTPVVAFDSGGVGDAVIDGVTGYLVPRGDCEALATQIVRAAGEDFRDRCRNYALKEFSLAVQARRYKDLYADLLRNPPSVRHAEIPKLFPDTAPAIAQMLAVGLGSSQTEMRHVKQKLTQVQKENEKMQQKMLQKLTQVQKENEKMQQKMLQTQKENQQIEKKNWRLREKNTELETERARLDGWIKDIERSTSWRVTLPLRAAGFFFKHNRKFWRLAREKLARK